MKTMPDGDVSIWVPTTLDIVIEPNRSYLRQPYLLDVKIEPGCKFGDRNIIIIIMDEVIKNY